MPDGYNLSCFVKPKFHYANFHRNFPAGKSWTQMTKVAETNHLNMSRCCDKVRDKFPTKSRTHTNHESRRRDLCRGLSWFVSATLLGTCPVLCRKVGVMEFGLLQPVQSFIVCLLFSMPEIARGENTTFSAFSQERWTRCSARGQQFNLDFASKALFLGLWWKWEPKNENEFTEVVACGKRKDLEIRLVMTMMTIQGMGDIENTYTSSYYALYACITTVACMCV